MTEYIPNKDNTYRVCIERLETPAAPYDHNDCPIFEIPYPGIDLPKQVYGLRPGYVSGEHETAVREAMANIHKYLPEWRSMMSQLGAKEGEVYLPGDDYDATWINGKVIYVAVTRKAFEDYWGGKKSPAEALKKWKAYVEGDVYQVWVEKNNRGWYWEKTVATVYGPYFDVRDVAEEAFNEIQPKATGVFAKTDKIQVNATIQTTTLYKTTWTKESLAAVGITVDDSTTREEIKKELRLRNFVNDINNGVVTHYPTYKETGSWYD